IDRTAEIFETAISKAAADEISKRSRGTPRIANRLLKRVRDISQVKGEKEIGFDTTQLALNMLQVDTIGLDHFDHKLLRSIIVSVTGGAVGLDTAAATNGAESETIEDVYEP